MSNNKPPKSLYRRELPSQLVELASESGKTRFQRALAKGNAEAFFPLIGNLQTQSHPAFCGLTTLSTVLNTLEIDPGRVWQHPWRWYSEELLECCLALEHVKKFGLTMNQVQMIAECEGTLVEAMRNSTEDEIRQVILKSVQGNGNIIVASYDRKVLGQTGSGHFSPIAAYDEETNSVLILDVARFKYPPHWVHLPLLLAATKSIDKQSGQERGFLSFQKPQDGQATIKCTAHQCCSIKWAVDGNDVTGSTSNGTCCQINT